MIIQNLKEFMKISVVLKDLAVSLKILNSKIKYNVLLYWKLLLILVLYFFYKICVFLFKMLKLDVWILLFMLSVMS